MSRGPLNGEMMCGPEQWYTRGPDLEPAKSGNLPPAAPPSNSTNRSLGELKSRKNDLMDVQISGEVLPDRFVDGTALNGTTSFQQSPAFSSPAYRADETGKITGFLGKFTWKGTVSIRTTYGARSAPKSLSNYGRGTTKADVKSRNVTLGFHETCHRQDYETYLEEHPLPDPPKLRVGMTVNEYKREVSRFDQALKAYWAGMEAYSEAHTDEVGYRESEHEKTGKPFEHKSFGNP